jgi:hypothetical protein
MVLIIEETKFVEKKKKNQNIEQYFSVISAINTNLIFCKLRKKLAVYYIKNIYFIIKIFLFHNKIDYLQLAFFYTNFANNLLFKVFRKYNTITSYYMLYVFSGILKINLSYKIRKDILEIASLAF